MKVINTSIHMLIEDQLTGYEKELKRLKELIPEVLSIVESNISSLVNIRNHKDYLRKSLRTKKSKLK